MWPIDEQSRGPSNVGLVDILMGINACTADDGKKCPFMDIRAVFDGIDDAQIRASHEGRLRQQPP